MQDNCPLALALTPWKIKKKNLSGWEAREKAEKK